MQLLELYKNIRESSVSMCKPLKVEDYIPQPEFFVSPPKWNLAHTTWFFEEMILKNYLSEYEEFHRGFGFLFNSYYNTLGERIVRHKRGDLSRPTVEEVYEYRRYVDEKMEVFIRSAELKTELEYLIILGLNHEQQHQELFFSDLKYTFSLNPLYPVYTDNAFCEESENETGDFVKVAAGNYTIGFEGDGFCFDNELNRHTVYLQDFEIRNTLVTNGEYLDFMENGGYENYEYWHDEALAWLLENNIRSPMYWVKENEKWHQYTLAGFRPIDPDHILTHISYYEAFAFAQWKGFRLPTEYEWEAASEQISWGKRWEWTESAYLPYPGYKKAKGAVGEYNGKFMVNQKVLRGSSIVTPKDHRRNTYRNFFHPHLGWQFNGIRLAK